MDRLVEKISIESIRLIINSWDPINLFPHAPNDEYDIEIKRIYNAVMNKDNENDIAKEIHKVFVKCFGQDVFRRSEKDCLPIAKRIILEGNRSGK